MKHANVNKITNLDGDVVAYECDGFIFFPAFWENKEKVTGEIKREWS